MARRVVVRARRRAAAPGFPRRRGSILVATGAIAGALVPTIHYGFWPMPLHVYLRDWGMHCFAVYAAAIGTLLVLGFFQADTTRRRSVLRRLGVATPLAVTLLHELGQSIWPHDQWELWDTVRDALLNVLGALLAWRLVREPVSGVPTITGPSPESGSELAPPAPRR